MALPTSVTIVFLLLSAGHAGPAASKVPAVFDLAPYSVCSRPAEVICSTDCTQLLLCLSDGADGYVKELVAACPSDQRCSADQAACVAPGSTECHPPVEEPEFPCMTAGDFPDPYDCQKYHICTGPDAESVRGTCDGTTAYNPLKADCSLTTSDRVCTEGPIPPCTKLGQVGIVPENPSIFYICKQMGDDVFPAMHKCPGNQIFDTDVATCVAP